MARLGEMNEDRDRDLKSTVLRNICSTKPHFGSDLATHLLAKGFNIEAGKSCSSIGRVSAGSGSSNRV